MELTYFNIQRFCLRDGPGIRTTLFLKGCPLRCLWCHNPEGQSPRKELLFRNERCVGCGRCLGLCSARSVSDGKVTVDRSLCTACGRCVDVCVPECNEICGVTEDADSVFEKLVRDLPYFENSGGGVTVSGGEPMSQGAAVIRLASLAAKRGVAFALETSGFGKTDDFLTLASLGALFLFDVKGAIPSKHKINTGVLPDNIIENLDALTECGADIILRMPIVPGYNDSEEDLKALCALLSKYRGRVRHAEIMPYHRIGLGKLGSLGKDAGQMADVPDGKEYAEEWRRRLGASGVEIKIG